MAGGSDGFEAADTSVHLWKANGTSLTTLTGHRKAVTSLAWSPDGQLLASGSLDGTVRFWSPSGAALPPGITAPHPVFAVAWSPDGQSLTVGSVGRSAAATPGVPSSIPDVVQRWSRDGQLTRTLSPALSTGGKFLRLAWSHDGGTLAAGAVSFAI
ncbi:MAG TPA: hypothetical protein VFI42_15525 [Thermomicrobiaceae bacterium]|nr:hypothetical protein [Thermomicrobiaceae bacterium]